MSNKFDLRSIERLRGVHSKLQELMHAVRAQGHNFIITEGLRTLERQRQLVVAGASRTLNSRHLHGFAVDVAVRVGNTVRWDWPLYVALGSVVKETARGMNIPIVWGGDWRHFRDGPHYELDRLAFPDP